MIEVIILIPLADNSGETFSTTHDSQFEGFLERRFGGFTKLPGTVFGGWVDPETGITYRDHSAAYLVLVKGVVGSSGALLEAASFAKAHYRQEAILIRYLGVAEII